jgi:hypothetical protein
VGGTLADGQYTATVTDLAGNQATASFVVQTQPPTLGLNTPGGDLAPDPVSSSGSVVAVISSTAGISNIAVNGSTLTLPCDGTNTAVDWGAFLLPAGSYVPTITDCAGNISTPTITSVAGTVVDAVILADTGSGDSHSGDISANIGAIQSGYVQITISTFGEQYVPFETVCLQVTAPGPCSYIGGNNISRTFTASPGYYFTITDTAGPQVSFPSSLEVQITMYNSDGTPVAGATDLSFNPGYTGAAYCQLTPSDVGQTYTQTVSSGQFNANVRYLSNAAQQTPTAENLLGQLKQVLIQVGNMFGITGSNVVYTSTSSINFTDSGVYIDTTTLNIYRFDGVAWDSAAVNSQQIALSTSGVLSATGTITQGGSFALFYVGQDSSAPITTFSIQGSSSIFDQTLFVSTYSYAVLTATDPVVNGFASQVATITYCLDPSSGSVFSVYTSSIPLPLGTHVLEFQSVDYAGNLESMNFATFTVTAGTVFKDQSDDTIAGNLLVGFLGSGAQAEVVARARDSITLQVSSANHQPMLAVTNIGNVGVGVQAPAGQLDVGSSSVALQLKSGNLTSTGTSVEAAFGYSGDVSMRHALKTFHRTSTVGNEMDFFVWTPDAGSTGTLATSELLALQASAVIASGGSMHVVPVGTAVAELEVSNGLSTGGGTMQRLQVLTPSSKRFKSDITYLKEKDEDRALAETAALTHVRYRYRSRAKDGSLYDDPRQQVRVGLIYEDSPESIRGAGQTLLTNERLANVEMALKAAMRKLEVLEKRYKDLQARRPQ